MHWAREQNEKIWLLDLQVKAYENRTKNKRSKRPYTIHIIPPHSPSVKKPTSPENKNTKTQKNIYLVLTKVYKIMCMSTIFMSTFLTQPIYKLSNNACMKSISSFCVRMIAIANSRTSSRISSSVSNFSDITTAPK